MLGYSFCKFCNSCRDFNCFTWNNNFNRKEKLAPRVEDATDYYCFVSFHFVTRILRIIRWIIINHDHLINPIHWQLIRIIHSPPVVRANNWSDDRCNDRLRDSQNEIRRNSKSANSEILDIIITANSWHFQMLLLLRFFILGNEKKWNDPENLRNDVKLTISLRLPRILFGVEGGLSLTSSLEIASRTGGGRGTLE